jgi:hypothetical protein
MPFGGSTSSLSLFVMDSTNTNTIFTFSACSGTTCTVNWNVTATANYYLKASSSNPAQEYSQIIMYYLFATVDNQARLRVVDILRSHVVKIFYVSQDQSATFSQYPVNDPAASYLTLVAFGSGSSINPSVLSSSQLSPTTTVNGLATYNIFLSKGYYGIVVT